VSVGDRLVSIDDVYVDRRPFQSVLESMKGSPGSVIRLSMLRDKAGAGGVPVGYTCVLKRAIVQGVGVIGKSRTISTNPAGTPTSPYPLICACSVSNQEIWGLT